MAEAEKAADGASSDAAEGSPPAGESGQVDVAVDRFRETAKWLIAAFGAIGATLINSLELGDLGPLEGSDEVLAVVGLAAGVVGILVALVAAATILATTRVTLGEIRKHAPLRRFVQKNPELLSGYETIEDLATSYNDGARARNHMYREWLAAAEAGKGTQAKAAQRRYELANRELELVNPALDRLLAAALFEKVRRRWSRTVLPWILVGVLLTAGGMGLFASRAPEDPPEEPAVAATPARAAVALSSEGKDELRAVLGPSCDLDAIEVVVLRSSSDATAVVTADDKCHVRELTLSPDDGRVVARDTVPIPPPPAGGGTNPTRTR